MSHDFSAIEFIISERNRKILKMAENMRTERIKTIYERLVANTGNRNAKKLFKKHFKIGRAHV